MFSFERRRTSKSEKSKERQDDIRAIIGKVTSGSCPFFLFSAIAKVLSVHKVNA